jgi:hypothetical protein
MKTILFIAFSLMFATASAQVPTDWRRFNTFDVANVSFPGSRDTPGVLGHLGEPEQRRQPGRHSPQTVQLGDRTAMLPILLAATFLL